MRGGKDEGERRPHRRTLKWSLGVLAALVIIIAILFGLFRVAANMIPSYRKQVVRQISTQIGAPVSLGRISLAWHGWGPELRLRDLRILSAKTGKPVLSAKRVRLDFTLPALVHGTGARPYRITLVGPWLTAEETPGGGFRIPGLDLSGGGLGRLGAMLGEQLRVRDGTLRLRLAGGKRETWVFAPLELRVGGGKTHAVRLSLGLPQALGAGTLNVAGTIVTRHADPSGWRWRGQYRVDKLRLAPLDRFLPKDWPAVSGVLAVDGQARGEGGTLAGASGRLSLRRLEANQGRLQRVRTDYSVTRGKGFAIGLTHLDLTTPERSWKPGRLRFGRAAGGRVNLSVARLDLALLLPLAGFLPSSLDDFRQRLAKMQPAGTVRNLDLSFKPGEIQSLSLSAQLENIAVEAAEGAPGFAHLSGRANLSHGAGIFRLDAPNLTMRMPHIFSHLVHLDRVSGRIGLAFTAAGVRIALPRLSITGPAGLDATVMARIGVPHAGPVTVYLAAAQPHWIPAVPARARYLPTGMLPKPLVKWLMNQLDGGRVGDGSMRFAGQAMRFPFKHGGGYFAVNFRFKDVTLKPGRGWMPIKGLAGSVHFKNAGMRAEVGSGRVVNARLVNGNAAIPDLAHPQLNIKTEVTGGLADFVAFLRQSPAGSKLKSAFSHFQASGAARTRLNLELPVLHPDRFELAGTLTLKNAALSYTGTPYALTGLAGSLSYDGRGPVEGQLKGDLMKAPIAIHLARAPSTSGDNTLRVAMDGRFPVATLSRAAKFDFAPYARGSLPLHAELAVPLAGEGLPLTVYLFSRLDGFELKLPMPAGKSSVARLPFAARIRVGMDGLDLAARYANVAFVCARLSTAAGGPTMRAVRLALGASNCTAPALGYVLSGGWRRLKIKPWLNQFATLAHGQTSGGSGWPGENLNVDLRFGEVDELGQRWRNQSIRGRLGRKQMNILLGGPDLAGRIVIPRHPTNADPIIAEFDRGHFTLPRKHVAASAPATASGTAVTSSVPIATSAPAVAAASGSLPSKSGAEEGGLKPQDIPPFSFHAQHLDLGHAALNDVTIVARRVPGGILVKPIRIGGGALSLNGQLAWLAPAASGSQGALQFVADFQHLGQFLAGLGLGPVVTGHGALSAGLAWHEPPGGGKFARGLLGKVSTDLRDGNISEVSPGAGRLLSLLSLVNIPRYLVFNFHNLFSKGFPFSRIFGDYRIEKGVAHTDALNIESSIAHIKLEGTVNLVSETMNQTAEVEPHYFGSLPVIGAILGGLGVGAAIYVLTKIFGSPLAEATKMTYSIKGPITHPTVKKLGGGEQAPAPASAGGAQ